MNENDSVVVVEKEERNSRLNANLMVQVGGKHFKSPPSGRVTPTRCDSARRHIDHVTVTRSVTHVLAFFVVRFDESRCFGHRAHCSSCSDHLILFITIVNH